MSEYVWFSHDELCRFAHEYPECLDGLTVRERRIWTDRRAGRESRKSLALIAEEMGISVGRVRQVQGDAEQKIRRFMQAAVRPCGYCEGRGWA